ncbi:MAG TPA: CsgG/HfaB family protein [Gemmatimonadales bacterium]|nr:CsgG/HfaB family protein [Gemmatimonadales bacterium]
MKRLASGTMALAFAALAFGAGRAQAQQAAATPAAAPQQQQDARPGIAVLDFELGLVLGQDHDSYDALRKGLAALTISELTANPGIRVVERAQLQQILQEQNLGHEGRVSDESVVQIGKLIGAHYMVTGILFDNKGDMRIDARIFDTETSQILKTSSVRGHMADLYDMVPRLAQQLMHDANLPPLERHALEEFRQQNPAPPTQAVMAYSRAVLYADRGDKDHAVEQYRRAIAAFPGYTQAKNDCNRLQAGACS